MGFKAKVETMANRRSMNPRAHVPSSLDGCVEGPGGRVDVGGWDPHLA